MKFSKVRLASIGHFLPNKVMTSEELEMRCDKLYQRLNLPHGRLELMTGIKERRYWDVGTKPSFIATEAAKDALFKTHIKSHEVDFLIHASVCRDFLEPATSSVVHQNLGLKSRCGIFDLSNACLGVQSAMVTVASMIEQGQIRSGLIVSGENSGPLIFETIRFLNSNPNLNRKNVKEYIANLT
ncbi:MAG: 3-oxoacyl-ACP synthase III, partial [Bdellovibrionota bacterium]|nr:3-oxoacyl-ACP synthase III [Bdellovibrionota bacterium]